MTHSVSGPAPFSTYRLQLSPDFGFAEAEKVLPYLAELGVTHVYLSPYLASTPGSAHGYDIVDPTRIREELGGAEAHARFVQTMKSLGLEQMIDVVPNHLGIDSEHNRYFWDVLENGSESPFNRVFDIDWRAHEHGKIVLPILPMPLEQAISERYVTCRVRDERVLLFAGERALPLAKTSRKRSPAELLDLSSTTDGMEILLAEQHYQLAYYLTGLDQLNYRRFLDIASLGATVVEDPEVFRELHEKILSFVADGSVSAMRIDHPDGLTDPEGYFLSLRKAAPSAWIVAEKITAPMESLPESWPVDGTTGYELLRLLTGMFVAPEGLRELESAYAAFVRRSLPAFSTLLRECKRYALTELLAPETRRVARALENLVGPVAKDAVIELIANMEVGRTYGRPGHRLSTREQQFLREALVRAYEQRPDLEGHLSAIVHALTDRPVSEATLRFQQLSAAAHAKGLEDTAFYRYGRLLAVNEVGIDPSAPMPKLSDFHRTLRQNRDAQPQSLLCTTTHDTKRGEDTRLRIAALSEVPEAWSAAVLEWSTLLSSTRPDLLDRETEYFVLQTLVGVWPISEERLVRYVLKAVREARRETTWIAPNLPYEEALSSYVRAALNNTAFVRSLEEFLSPIVEAAGTHALTQTLVKLTAPGIPDIYQGSELWDLSLVDPDNRRPVDFTARARLLAELKEAPSPERVLARKHEGLAKLWVLHRALMVRRERAMSLAPTAPYEPLVADNDPFETVIAYLRGRDVLVIAPRFSLRHRRAHRLPTLQLPQGPWRNELTGEVWDAKTVGVSELLERFPVALLTRIDPRSPSP